MKTKITVRKVVAVIITITFVSFMVSPTPGRAGYLIPPGYPEFDAGPCPERPPHPIHHHKTRYHKRHLTECTANFYPCPGVIVVPACAPCQGSSHDFVEFNSSPSYGNGRYLTNNNDNYDLDLSTGDDDPAVYPGMDIDN